MYHVLMTTLLLVAAATCVSAKTSDLGGARVHTGGPTGKRTSVFVKPDLTAYRGDEGPFKLSIYEAPVSGDGKCDGAKNVLDPFQRGDKPECDRKSPQTCQVGDLVSKHGEIPKFQGVISVKQSFQDLYSPSKKDEKASGTAP
ncbi:hypothetical protein C7212DRAFT_345848 [Tuber magnatum]|uniref:Uncharacterized protein n=1 Tax=Tuber magnatum TaxID=42249 RepID=A0A317SMN7_9PEZI|nr:hypothetical protein C7212DRAFT_345848 [Tuber magnatum]